MKQAANKEKCYTQILMSSTQTRLDNLNSKNEFLPHILPENGLLTNRCLHRAEVGGPLRLKPACSGTKDEVRQAAPAPLFLQSGLI